MPTPTHMSENGNALFLILIAVALFAALSYAITQSSKGGGGNISKETALLYAAELTQYTSSIENAVMRMKISGVKDTDFCFDSNKLAEPKWYDNNPSCSNPENKVFDLAGGGYLFV